MIASPPPVRSLVLALGFALVGPATPRRAGAQSPPPSLEVYRSRAADAARPGDPELGRRLWLDAARTRCLACHAIGGKGANLGPDLLGLGDRMTAEEVAASILEPSVRIHPDYASTSIATRSGRVLVGLARPVGDGSAEVEVFGPDATSTRVRLDEVEERAPSPVSLMPAGLEASMTPDEFAGLVAFLRRSDPSAASTAREAVDPRDVPRATRPVDFPAIHPPEARFDHPGWVGAVPGQPGVLAVAEVQSGRIWRLEPGPGPGSDASGDRRKVPFADLSGEILPGEITGLMGVAFHPDFARNRRYFAKLHGPRRGGRLSVTVVERKASADGLADSGEPSKVVIDIPVVSEIHNGGHVAFGPDGLMYLGMGDTGPQDDPRGHGQDLGQWLGKMLRIDVDRVDEGRNYAVPADNPFVGRPGARPEIFALGFREPWRFSFDRGTGDLWVGDVGQNRFEEVAIVRKGENHGWNVLEGFQPHSDRFRRPEARFVDPVFAYGHRVGVSVTGGFVYRGGRNPSLRGRYVFGDFESRRVWALEARDGRLASIVEVGRSPDRIVSFGEDEAGEITLLGYDLGMVHRVDASKADLSPSKAVEVVPTSRTASTTWRMTLDRPGDGWERPGFDDAGWAEAAGGFGRRGTPSAVVRTEWTADDIWLRRAFNLAPFDPSTLTLAIHHDEDVEVYLNGVLAASLAGFVGAYDDAVPIRPEALATLLPGPNLLAVHCHQARGGQYVDVGIVATVPAR